MAKKHVMSLRLDDEAYRRLRAYASSRGVADSAAARELLAAGLARDGLELYSTELGAYLRGVMGPLVESFEDSLERRNAEQEDRIARVVHRAARGAVVAAIASCELLKEAYPGLADVPARRRVRGIRRAGAHAAGRHDPGGGDGPCVRVGAASSCPPASTSRAPPAGRRRHPAASPTSRPARAPTARPRPRTRAAPASLATRADAPGRRRCSGRTGPSRSPPRSASSPQPTAPCSRS